LTIKHNVVPRTHNRTLCTDVPVEEEEEREVEEEEEEADEEREEEEEAEECAPVQYDT
jgi:hypothetical protein